MSRIIVPNIYMSNTNGQNGEDYYPIEQYPMPLDDQDWEEMLEQQYWKRLYPQRYKDMQEFVMEQSDRLDYAGSLIYDEMPDQISLERSFERIYQLWTERYQPGEEMNLRELVETQMDRTFPPSPPMPTPTWKDILRILFYQEIQNRRRRRRWNQRRYW